MTDTTTTAAPRRVAAYLRVSTDRQAERGHGLTVQRAAITAWAQQGGYKIVAWFSDDGISGSNGLADRVALGDAMDAVKAGRADGIAVYRLDRLARDVILQETLLRDLRKLGGDLWSTSASEAQALSDDPDDPSRKLIRVIMGAVAEYEKDMITLRMRRGRAVKARSGRFAYGSPRFGLTSVGGDLERDPAEAAAVEVMRDLAARGLTTRQIAAALNADGVPAKRGGRWHHSTVARVLARP